jgi:TRAP-type C4-dicarboxylate transport system permease small subunit
MVHQDSKALKLVHAIDTACRAGAVIACLSLFVLFVICLTEIVSRALFSHSSALVGEYSEYLLLSSLLLGSGWALRHRMHVRVALLIDRIPERFAYQTRFASTALALLVSLIASVAMTDFALGTLQRGTLSYHPSATPLWVPQMVAAVGFWLLFLGVLAELIDPQRVPLGEAANTEDH